MNNKDYKINRDDIYVGEVVEASSICKYKDEEKLSVRSYKPYRSMLFVVNKDKLSDDLLYDCPNYPILNITDDAICLKLKENSVVIKDAISLSSLLKYFGYSEYLTINDIIKIKKEFFTGCFAKDNCELFGYKETMAEDVEFYDFNGNLLTGKDLEKMRKRYKLEQTIGYRSFSKPNKGTLNEEYFNVLDDNTEFKPNKNEGHVKKLTRK